MVAEKVAAALGVALVPRESSYWGDPYYSGWPKSEIKLTENLDPMFRQGDPPEERWFCSEARDASYLIWETQGNEAVLAALQDARLRRCNYADLRAAVSGDIPEHWRTSETAI